MAILDPMILLDHASIGADSPLVGFPRHPHRGIETLSYVLSGEVGHKDSKGNEGKVGAGGSQWMVAGNGIWHEEMLIPGPEGAEFLQLWFSLPKDKKRIPCGYYGGPSDAIPTVTEGEATIRVVAGAYQDQPGFFQEIVTQPTVLDVSLRPSGRIEIPVPVGDAVIAYVVRGTVRAGDRSATQPEVIVFGEGDSVEVTAGPERGRFLLVSAKPLEEPILQYRSFVMNTADDIRETVEMIESGTFGL